MNEAAPLSLATAVDQFLTAMRSAGIEFDGAIVADGRLHRFRVSSDKAGTKNGWYVLHGDGIPAGAFGCYRRDIRETWHANIGRRLTPAEEAANRQRLEAARAARAADEAKEHERARKRAADLWGQARPSVRVTHPYLVAKSVRAFGLRQLREQLLVPVRDIAGQLHGLQFIDERGRKKFLTGTAKAGHYHAIGGKPKAGTALAIVEGYATGATVHALTGWPVACTFDAGNLRAVAVALYQRFPGVRLVLCADNDHRRINERTGEPENVGLLRARDAAEACGGTVLAPEFGPGDTGSDWNDYATARGPEVARQALLQGVETAVPLDARPTASEANHPDSQLSIESDSVPPSGTAPPSAGGRSAKVVSLNAKRADAAPRRKRMDYPVGFTVDEGGVWYRAREKNGDDLQPPFFVCPPLRVLALLRDSESENWGLLLEFDDKDGVTHRWALPWRMFSGDGAEMRSELLRLGFFVPPSRRARELFVEYVSQARPEARALSVERTGWHGRVFVLPDRTIGEASEPVYFQSESLRDRVYREAGDLGEWRTDVADLCRGNSRLVFAVSAAFASMLLHWIGEECGGFHFRGGSSTGKTTALRVAASVFGGSEYLRRWRATDNALEAVASMHNDALLILDELAQVDPKVAGNAAYMLGNGEGKQRAYRTGTARTVLRWRLLFLSAGEISLAEHMRQDGKKAQAGQETRLAEIPADAGHGLGMFEALHGYADGAAFSRAIVQAAARYHGAAASAFVAALLPTLDSLANELRHACQAFVRGALTQKADGQVWRVANRFALVAAGGEMATRLGVTGWEPGEAERAARTCFRAWLEQRGSSLNIEPMRMVEQVRAYLERHGEARFAPWKDDGSNDWITRERAGFRKPFIQSGTLESADAFYVLRETFRDEICAGYDHRDVARALAETGALQRDEKSRKFTRRERLPRLGLTHCYVILPSIWTASAADFSGDDSESAGTVGTAGTDEAAP